MANITLNWLRRRGACSKAQDSFKDRFGKRASVEDIVNVLHELGMSSWEAWLLAQDINLTVSMLAKGADLHAHGDAVICWAVENGCLRIVQLLLERGADVHAYDDVALCWAAEDGNLEVVKLLIEHGANIHAKNNSALRVAAGSGHAKVLKFLTRQSEKA